jgi:hypothetical protein
LKKINRIKKNTNTWNRQKKQGGPGEILMISNRSFSPECGQIKTTGDVDHETSRCFVAGQNLIKHINVIFPEARLHKINQIDTLERPAVLLQDKILRKSGIIIHPISFATIYI